MAAIVEIHESKRNAQVSIRSGNGALEHIMYSEVAADSSQISSVPCHVGARALRSDDLELRHAGKPRGDFVPHTVGKKSFLGISAGIFEREHCNRVFGPSDRLRVLLKERRK